MRVCKCPDCGLLIRDNPLWRGSRYDFNADYMRFIDAQEQPELKDMCSFLEFASNFEPCVWGPNTFYRRGKGGNWLYRVPTEDFKVETEKRRPKGKQLRLPVRLTK
jgi:hypothetical protein